MNIDCSEEVSKASIFRKTGLKGKHLCLWVVGFFSLGFLALVCLGFWQINTLAVIPEGQGYRLINPYSRYQDYC